MINIRQKGDFKNLSSFLEKTKEKLNLGLLDKYGREGVAALQAATPKDTGKTSESWYYKIEHNNGSARIVFCNSNINEGVPIAIILQYGHGTGTGGWVEGIDYINPAIQPIFNKISDAAWKEVTKI